MEDAYLLDTGIASIAWDAGHPSHSNIRDRLVALGDVSLSICSVTIGEVTYGLEVSPAIDLDRHNIVKQAMLAYQILDINKHTGSVYAKLRGELFKQYAPKDRRGRIKVKRPESLIDRTTSKELGIQENDLWIVSVAVQYDLGFITSDKMELILTIAKNLYAYDRFEVWSIVR